MPEGQYALDFFAGGVPAVTIFRMHLQSISELLQIPMVGVDSTIQELAYIGVVSYTEAFFKDHFAAVLNIFPEKAVVLRECRRDVTVDLIDILELGDDLHSKLGFLLSERFNFGAPKAINALYKDLLLITPFSRDKALAFDRVLAIRNLLVHHGGTLTTQFNRGVPAVSRERTYYDSVSITNKQVGDAALLALEVVKETVDATVIKLSTEFKDMPSSDIRREALKFMEEEIGLDAELSASLIALISANPHSGGG